MSGTEEAWPSGRESHSPAPDSPQPSAPAAPKPRSRGRRALRAIGWTLAGSGVVALVGLSGYLWITHEEWVDQNDQLRTEALDLGEELSAVRAEAAASASDLAETTSQLEEAKSTITSLANDDANAGDGLRVATRIIEQTQVCADERAELIDYLKNSEQYTASSLQQAESEIDAFCADIEESWTAYLDEQE